MCASTATLRGQVDLEGGLTIGPQAQVVAPLRATRVEVLGEVHGTIDAQHVVVKSGGWVTGDVRAGTIAIDDGATLEGLIDMDFETDSRARASAPAGRARAPEDTLMQGSRLPRGVVLEGSVRGQGDSWIAGEIQGPVEIDGQLVIEPTGVVRGEVRARSIAIAGVLEGNATAIELVRLEPGARMVGDARAERVSAAAGALLRGRIRTGQDRAQQERMRRTTGGTLLAPFSSSGSVRAPSFTLEDEPAGPPVVGPPVVSPPIVGAPIVSASIVSPPVVSPPVVGAPLNTPQVAPTPEPEVLAAVQPLALEEMVPRAPPREADDDQEPLRQLAARPHRTPSPRTRRAGSVRTRRPRIDRLRR